mmetsp:Transcript_12114/g.35829  ORF Transcript_12114/g.35829 Transcript_12114/m.35829 type:complete len:279 (-) Transcript_12114:1049-1885(-)
MRDARRSSTSPSASRKAARSLDVAPRASSRAMRELATDSESASARSSARRSSSSMLGPSRFTRRRSASTSARRASRRLAWPGSWASRARNSGDMSPPLPPPRRAPESRPWIRSDADPICNSRARRDAAVASTSATCNRSRAAWPSGPGAGSPSATTAASAPESRAGSPPMESTATSAALRSEAKSSGSTRPGTSSSSRRLERKLSEESKAASETPSPLLRRALGRLWRRDLPPADVVRKCSVALGGTSARWGPAPVCTGTDDSSKLSIVTALGRGAMV